LHIYIVQQNVKKILFQSEDEALARALAESERLTNENTTANPQARCSVA